MSFCTKCGKPNPDIAKFCTGCGATLKIVVTQKEQSIKTPEITNPVKAQHSSKTKTKPFLIGLLLFLGLCTGTYFIFFNKKKANSNSTTTVRSDTTTNIAEEPKPDKNIGSSESHSLTESEIFSFLNEWLNAQNNKNIVTYSSFYSQDFQGIKRIKSGQIYYYNHDEWITDRTKMYTSAKNLIMTVSNVKITGNNGREARVNFTHGYSSDAYKDIGEKQIEIEKADDGKIYITKEEMLNSSTPSNDDQGQASFTNSDGKLVYKSDCFVIITGSFLYETDAKIEVRRMINEGYSNAGYLWIPDYPSLSGKEFYAPFVGPFNSYGECENNLKSLAKTGRFWYGIKVSFDNTRVEIR